MLKYILLCILAMSGYYAWTSHPVTHGAGIIAPDKPVLKYVSWEKPFTYKESTLTPVKLMEAEVRVLEKKRYFFDEYKELSPVDVLVGWDEMSDERNLEFINFRLQNRAFSMEFIKPPIPETAIYNQVQLMHVIPANNFVKEDLLALKKGELITFKGMLVHIESTVQPNWTTDLLLTGTKKWKTQILWVEELKIK